MQVVVASVGQTVRIFFCVGGPKLTSSLHVIGEIFDKVYILGGVRSAPLEGIQTVAKPLRSIVSRIAEMSPRSCQAPVRLHLR